MNYGLSAASSGGSAHPPGDAVGTAGTACGRAAFAQWGRHSVALFAVSCGKKHTR